MVEKKLQSEPQPRRSPIDFNLYGYKESPALKAELEERLNRAGEKRVVEVATQIFGPKLAAYAARAISKEEYITGDTKISNEFKEGTFNPTDENLIALLVALDFAQRMRDTKQPDEKMLKLFTPTAPEYKGLANTLNQTSLTLETTHGILIDAVAKWNEVHTKQSKSNSGQATPYGPKFTQKRMG